MEGRHAGAGPVGIGAFLFYLYVYELTVFELDDPGRILPDELVVVGRHKDRGTSHVDLPDELHDFGGCTGVKIAGRLIGQKDGRSGQGLAR